jgi:hypothetical protein
MKHRQSLNNYINGEETGAVLRYFQHVYRGHPNLLGTSLLSPNNSIAATTTTTTTTTNNNNNNNNNNNMF